MAKVDKKSKAANEQDLAFREDRDITFATNFSSFLTNLGFQGIALHIPITFGDGLKKIMMLLDTPVGLKGDEFDVEAKALPGFQFVNIFGSKTVTVTIKQIAVYTGYYVEQARLDSIAAGLPISLHHFSDRIMETAHKNTKLGSMRNSGGREGPLSKVQYQEALLSQHLNP